MMDLLQSLGLAALCFGMYYGLKSNQLHHEWLKDISDRGVEHLKISGQLFSDLELRVKRIERKLDNKPKAG